MFIQEKVNKDNRQTTQRVGTSYFDSILEAQEAVNIIEAEEKGKITSWKKQVPLDFYIVIEDKKPILKCNPTDNERRYGYWLERYYIDFQIDHKDGTIELIEVKGQKQVKDWKRKWNMVQAVFGDDPNYILKLKL